MNCTIQQDNEIRITGRIDSGNSADFEKELFECADKIQGDITLDFSRLEYVSSAGLRVLLKLRKKFPKVNITNVSREVYEIFEMTGFAEMFNISKALRVIDITDCELIGRGGNGAVYRISNDEIVKTYRENTPDEVIEKERQYAHDAFVAGVPTAIPYDVVKVGDSLGIIFEMIKADLFSVKLNAKPDKFEDNALAYARLFKEIHQVDVANSNLPTTKSLYLNYVNRISEWYTSKEIDKLTDFINSIPDRNTVVHGDFHTNNVMVQDDELMIIDMAEMSYGHPIFDLAASYYVHMLNARIDPDAIVKYLGISVETSAKLWNKLMRVFFDTEDEEKINNYNRTIERFCMLKSALIPAIWFNMPRERKQAAVDRAREYLFPYMDELLEDLKAMNL